MAVGMTAVDLSTTTSSVTSSLQSCLPVKVPIETDSNVGTAALAVSAIVGIIVGALVALIVGWLIFRQCIGKVCDMFLGNFLKLLQENGKLLMQMSNTSESVICIQIQTEFVKCRSAKLAMNTNPVKKIQLN